MIDLIKAKLSTSIEIKQAMLGDGTQLAVVQAIAETCIQALRNGNKLMLAGNGGSASDAQHIAAELVGRFEKDRPGMSAMALTTNSSSVTAIANDYGYDAIFQRQVEAFGRPGDVLIGLTTSGNSKNILNALDTADEIGVTTIGMTGAGGGHMAARCKYCLRVPSNNTAHVQEVHITVGHIICGLIEHALSA